MRAFILNEFISVFYSLTCEGGKTLGGRFCNIFKFRGELIASVHIYPEAQFNDAFVSANLIVFNSINHSSIE
jgi:hypothetical protein